jgi:hypothetical protein
VSNVSLIGHFHVCLRNDPAKVMIQHSGVWEDSEASRLKLFDQISGICLIQTRGHLVALMSETAIDILVV